MKRRRTHASEKKETQDSQKKISQQELKYKKPSGIFQRVFYV